MPATASQLYLLTHTFDELINSFIENQIGIAVDFLPTALAKHLKENLLQLHANKELFQAGTGNNKAVVHNKLMRSDIIYWLDKKHENAYENEFFLLMDAFVKELNSSCYTGITDYEFHYTLYETGSFYKKHVDQFRNNNSRKYSIILYLNENWQPEDGGELCIYHANNVQKISPENGKIVFFKSNEMEHEVLPTHKPRMSITGWLKVNDTPSY